MYRKRVFVLLAACLPIGCFSKPTVVPVWIGHIAPLEGANRALGRQARQGVALAVAEAHDAGLSLEGRPCAVLHVDSRDDAAVVRAETVRLLTVNQAIALLPDFDAALTQTMLRESRSYGAPVVVPDELPGPSESDIVLSLGVPPAVRGRLMARYASGELKPTRAAVLTDSRRPVASAFASAFLQAWPREGSREEWTFTTAAERDERLGRIIHAAPAIVVLACSLADFRLLRPRLAEALPKTPLIYGGEDAGGAALQADLETHSEVLCATAYSAEHLTDLGRAFVKGYQERFHEPPDLFAAQSYDAARLLLDTLQRAGTPNKEALGKELAQCEKFDSVTGSVRWKDRQPQRRVFVMALQNHKLRVVSTVEPEEN